MIERIEHDFTYHAPKEGQTERYEQIRLKAKEFAHFISSATPESEEQSAAILNLHQVVFWANAAIARNE